MAASTIRTCTHGINIKYCNPCSEAEAKKNRPSINDRILTVLNDGKWHTQREIAENAELLDRDGYVDIGRDIRNMRMEKHGSHPIDERKCVDEPMLHEYRLLPDDEAEAFWKRRDDRIASQAPNAKIAQDNIELKKKIESLEKEVEFLTAYIKELESKSN